MRTIYYGVVSTLMGNGRQAFIDRNTVLTGWLSPCKLNTAADIYVHQDDLRHKLVVGLELEFSLEKDTRRTKGNPLRATHVRAVKSLAHVRRRMLLGRVLGWLVLLGTVAGIAIGARTAIEAFDVGGSPLVILVSSAISVVSFLLGLILLRRMWRYGF